MASTGARILRLLAFLQSRRDWTAEELAHRLEVSTRTVRRDVNRLRDLGYPVSSEPGAGKGYRLGVGASLPPLVLDDDEAVALVVALGDTARTGVVDISEAAVLALAKITRMLPQRLGERAEAVAASTVNASWSSSPGGAPAGPSVATLGVLGEACRDGVRLDFGYTSRAGVDTDRRVEPYHLVTLGARWYLLAYDCDRNDWRTFRVDRLRDPRPLRNTFQRRPLPDDDVARFVRDQVGSVIANRRVKLEVRATPDELRPWIDRRGSIEELAEGWCRVTIQTDRFHWIALMLTSVEAPFIVVDPPELIDELRHQARFLLTNLDGPGPRG
jgi:predicted DNA-binding transcriptional regulator YafY